MWFRAEYTDEGIFHVDIESGEEPPEQMWRFWEGLIAAVIYDIARHRQVALEKEGKERELTDEVLHVLSGVSLELVHKRLKDRRGDLNPLRPRLEVVDANSDAENEADLGAETGHI